MRSITLTVLTYLCIALAKANPTAQKEGRKLRVPNPEETAGFVEGDMDIPLDTGTFRSTIKDKAHHWPNGVVAFTFSTKEKELFSDEEKRNITLAMDQFHQHTCIKFVPRTPGQKSYIRFRKGRGGCSSNVGMMTPSQFFTREGQDLSLGPPCFKRGTIMHEMMHALGFYHEQARWDRDDYVVIKPEHVMKGMLGQFRIFNLKRTNFDLGAPYDYGSLMHYSRNAFALYDDEETIVPMKPGVEIGQREAFSDIDIWKINKLYKCPDVLGVTLAPELHTTPAKPDFILNPTPPPKPKEQFYCNFDYLSACGMRDGMESVFDWEIKGGSTSTPGTGPDKDVSGKGYYIYAESTLRQPGEKAILATPYLKAKQGGACLKFYYHMYGKDMGTLRVFARDYTGHEQELFKKTGNQGNEWRLFTGILKFDKDFEIVFEGTMGGSADLYLSPESDIAIDKIEFRHLDLYPNIGCEATPDEDYFFG